MSRWSLDRRWSPRRGDHWVEVITVSRFSLYRGGHCVEVFTVEVVTIRMWSVSRGDLKQDSTVHWNLFFVYKSFGHCSLNIRVCVCAFVCVCVCVCKHLESVRPLTFIIYVSVRLNFPLRRCQSYRACVPICLLVHPVIFKFVRIYNFNIRNSADLPLNSRSPPANTLSCNAIRVVFTLQTYL